MRIVRTFLLYSLAITIISATPSGYDGYHGGRVRTKVIVVREPERRHIRHEVRQIVRRQRPVVVRTEECVYCDSAHHAEVSVIHEVAQPDLVVVDHGGAGYLQPQPAITHTHPVVQVAPVAPIAPVAPVVPTTRPRGIDP